MGMSEKAWTTVTPSRFPWEQEALAFIREGLPDHEPWRAWSTFEFIAPDGSINEVDLLVVGPTGFFLIEVKSWSGKISGDQANWLIQDGPQERAEDNPLRLANLKAKRLRALLERQPICSKERLPFIEPLVFLSDPDVRLGLAGEARTGIWLRDRVERPGQPGRRGILAALTSPDSDPAAPGSRQRIDKPKAKLITRALEQAGIKPSLATRRFGDFEIDDLLFESPRLLYQDFTAHHRSFPGRAYRLRLYPVGRGVPGLDRDTLVRAARREFELICGVSHPGILKALNFVEHDLGPALVFEHYRNAVRLDHFLAERGSRLGIDARLGMVRQIAEALAHAHEKRIVHRALSPQSILVLDPEAAVPRVLLFNWQTGARFAASSPGSTPAILPTIHIKDLIEDATAVYVAPETLHEPGQADRRADLFSLGAVAYHIFSGRQPAGDWMALHGRLVQDKGLDISADLDSAGVELRELLLGATRGDVSIRFDSVTEFLAQVEKVEEALTAPDEDFVDPEQARVKDRLEGGWVVKKRLGTGSTAVVFLVEKNGQESVLKIANGPESDALVQAEGEVLAGLHHENIVEFQELLTVSGRLAVRMKRAGETTLAERLRQEGPLLFDMLQRFGEHLLQTLDYLEKNGIAHRDIKPDNLGIAPRGKSEERHLVLFDFSLSRAPLDNVRAGTVGYLEPFLKNRKPVQWDTYAERYAAAVTLYEMASGTRPRWGDGASDPVYLDCEVTLEPERFESPVRSGLARFFARALRRDPKERFDNAEQMLLAWREAFAEAHRPPAPVAVAPAADQAAALASATPTSHLLELAFSTRALSALDRLGVNTVEELLGLPLMRILGMRGVGHRTRVEIVDAVKALRQRFPDRAGAETLVLPAEEAAPAGGAPPGLDQIFEALLPRGRKAPDLLMNRLLGLGDPDPVVWRTQTEVAALQQVTHQLVGQKLREARQRWRKLGAVSGLRETLVQILETLNGVASPGELAAALLAARGSAADEPKRTRIAWAVLRAAVEAEAQSDAPRFLVRRHEGLALVALAAPDGSCPLADYAFALGHKAEALAATDPLPGPAAVLEGLRSVRPPEAPLLPEGRLVRLAAAASKTAGASSRLELYPRGLDARRALGLAQAGLFTLPRLTPEAIQERVAARFPEAAPLPPRPQLDLLLQDAGLELEWQDGAAGGAGAFVPIRQRASTTFRTPRRASTTHVTRAATPLVLEAQRIENRLATTLGSGGFLALATAPRFVALAEQELTRRFPVARLSLEAVFLAQLQRTARELRVDWKVVRRTDLLGPEGPDWPKLLFLAQKAAAALEAEIRGQSQALLLTRPGLLVRYGALDLLSRLAAHAGSPGGPPAIWLLFPGDDQQPFPVIDGQALPVTTANQWTWINQAWLENAHRSGSAA